MEMWELIKRLLGGATESQSFVPGVIAAGYYSESKASLPADIPPVDGFMRYAEDVAIDLEGVGLLEDTPQGTQSLAILNCKRRTVFGEELYQALQSHNVVAFFEGMKAYIDRGEIQRLLYQLRKRG
ncbi:hypothetical protein [Pseudomonas sp. Irchel s3f19]|uniref:hypothetical protein n=1 Tax=Pseudomonas sp. Irchel s3f19 TaxID=2009146 RepID=UPI000BA36ECB|nr:hypothetical protein [Pseudomonas sp. Irchel s3f19]